LFLCTGNYYRSRFAEVFFNHHGETLGLPWQAVSRGLATDLGANNVGPLSAHARARLRELGIPHEPYLRFPQQVSAEDLERADLIVAVKEAEHRALLRERFPAWVERVEYWHVHDLDCATPQDALPCLEREVLALASRLLAGRAAAR
jgi:protein-tyrosine phosphatase